MNKKLLALTACLCLIVSLTACGSNPDAIIYGTVVPSSSDSTGASAELEAGMKAYAASVSKNGKAYTVSGNKKEGYKKALDQAAKDDKVKYIMAEGQSMETAVYDAQNDHHKTRFIFFDGQPREKKGDKAKIRSNTLCVKFGREDQGFLAGYAAVRAGYRTLGYIGGKKTKASRQYFNGFSEGAEYAASELGLSSGNVVLNYLYAGSDALTPMRLADAENFYNGGVQIIATDSESLMPALAKAADDLSKKTAAIGFEYSGSSQNVLYSSLSDYNGAAQGLLAEAEKKWNGGDVKSAGLADRAVRLSCNFSNMGSFTQDEYNSFLEKAAKDGIKNSDTKSGTKIVTMNQVPMVSPNPNSGVNESSVSGNQAAVSGNNAGDASADSVAEASSVPAEASGTPEEADSTAAG